MLMGILAAVAFLSYVLPAGTYERIAIDGRSSVVPGSYRTVASSPVSLLGLFVALPQGFAKAAPVIYVILASGVMFGIIERSHAIERAVGVLVRRLGQRRQALAIVLATFVYGMLGVFAGYETNIATIPIAAVLALALGGDLVLAAGISAGAMTVGFGLSPVNPYTVGIGHQLAELQMFSGWALRAALCTVSLLLLAWYNVRYYRRIQAAPAAALGAGLDTTGLQLAQPLDSYRVGITEVSVLLVFVAGLAVMLFGVFELGWFLDEISAIFLITAIVAGLVSRQQPDQMAEAALESVALVAPGAFLVGLANAVRVVMEAGLIGDTITHALASGLSGIGATGAALGMVGAQTLTNFLIPSGSGQALATLPVMIPVGDLGGLTRQVTVLAFQLGDGISNLVNPTLGGLVAMLSLCRVPFDRWLRFILPVAGMLLALGLLTLVASVWLGYA